MQLTLLPDKLHHHLWNLQANHNHKQPDIKQLSQKVFFYKRHPVQLQPIPERQSVLVLNLNYADHKPLQIKDRCILRVLQHYSLH